MDFRGIKFGANPPPQESLILDVSTMGLDWLSMKGGAGEPGWWEHPT